VRLGCERTDPISVPLALRRSTPPKRWNRIMISFSVGVHAGTGKPGKTQVRFRERFPRILPRRR
jgi:hypothetical protein